MQLRYLSGLQEIAGEKNSTIVFPFPLEFIKTFLREKEPDTDD
jgi:stomatin